MPLYWVMPLHDHSIVELTGSYREHFCSQYFYLIASFLQLWQYGCHRQKSINKGNEIKFKVSITEIFSPFDEIKDEFSNVEFFMFVFCREVCLFFR